MTGKLYAIPLSPRAQIAIQIVKFYGLDFEIVPVSTPSTDLAFDYKKVPYLINEKNIHIHQTPAVIEYLFSLVPEEKKKGYFGKNTQEFVKILSWNSLMNQELMDAIGDRVLTILGKMSFNKKRYDAASILIDQIGDIFETRLSEFTYLVGERLTISDIFGALTFAPAFKVCLDRKWASAHPNILRWFNTVIAHPMISSSFTEFKVIEKALTYQPPKKEKAEAKEKPKAEAKKEPAPKLAAVDEPVEEKKPKHPLEALGKPKLPIDEWKRVYSNEETRETALPWFWEHFDPSEWSLYKVGYKYNDELTLTFMSNNLVGGFFNRLSASTKYLFGCLVVYGENNDNGIVGAFLVRGQDYVPAFDVAPDWESYEYAKLDPTNDEDKEFINNMWAWDKPVIVDGKTREIADGKVFK